MNKKVISIIAVVMLIAVLGVVFTACNADSYQKKLEKAGYEVLVFEGDEAKEEAEVGDYEIKWVVTAGKLSGFDGGMVIKFAKIADAKAFEEKISDGSDEHVKRQSSILIVGTEGFVNDAK